MLKAEYTVFKDQAGFWYGLKSQERDIIAYPDKYRSMAQIVRTRLEACRLALSDAKNKGATEIHLYGKGATTTIKRDAKEIGIKSFVYQPSTETDLSFGKPVE